MTKKVTDEFASFVLGDGSGYISYWANVTDATYDGDDMTSLTLDEPDGDFKGTVTLADVKTACRKLAQLIKDGKFYGCCTGCTDEFLTFEGYDACTADAVIQLAALKEVVYG